MRSCAPLAVLGVLAIGCGAPPSVVRVYEGHAVTGRYVPPGAYAEFLRGAIEEASGDLAGARRAYEAVADADPEDPLVWARLGAVLCRQREPRSREEAARAFAKARAIDPAYAGALGEEARCAAASGDAAVAADLAARASALDPKNGELAALAVRVAPPGPSSPEARARALALTEAHGEREVAWEALVAWGRAHGDDELAAQGFAGLARLAPLRAREVEAGALDLLSRGRIEAARLVAAALAEAPRELGHGGPRDVTVARLAVDEAILRGDGLALRRRAARGHVLLAECAARAVALEKAEVARELARELAAADPAARGPAMVLAALGAEPAKAAPEPGSSNEAAPTLCAWVLAESIARTASAAAARAWLARAVITPPAPADPLAFALEKRLTSRGVLPSPSGPRS